MSGETPAPNEVVTYEAFCTNGGALELADLFNARGLVDRERPNDIPPFPDMPTWTHDDISDTEAALAMGILEHKDDLRSWRASEVSMPYIAERLVQDLREDLTLKKDSGDAVSDEAFRTLDLVADSISYRESEQKAVGH